MLLNREAQSACADALKLLAPKTERDPFAQICGAFLHKAAETLSAVNVLYANELQEPAQSLIRILFELRINFDCLRRLANNDLRGAVQRVADGMMLEKIKQARASEYAGIPAELRALLEKDEAEISARYTPDELNRIKKHGFTGVPIEQRANLTGHEAAYSIVYRNFSRNIHSTDYVESYVKAGIHSIENTESYNQSRDAIAHYTAHFSAVGILEFANHIFSLGMEAKIKYLGQRQADIKALPDDL